MLNFKFSVEKEKVMEKRWATFNHLLAHSCRQGNGLQCGQKEVPSKGSVKGKLMQNNWGITLLALCQSSSSFRVKSTQCPMISCYCFYKWDPGWCHNLEGIPDLFFCTLSPPHKPELTLLSTSDTQRDTEGSRNYRASSQVWVCPKRKPNHLSSATSTCLC